MNFPTALGAVFNACRATRISWGDKRRFIWLNNAMTPPRVRYETPYKHKDDRRMDWSYYPTQLDMLATDWELVSPDPTDP